MVQAQPTSTTTRADYINRVCAGGFPLALRRQGAARNRWFDDEVDLLVEFDDGRVLAFAVKASERIPGEDLQGLRKFRNQMGDRFIAGVAFNTGTRSYSYEGEGLHVLPVDRIWS